MQHINLQQLNNIITSTIPISNAYNIISNFLNDEVLSGMAIIKVTKPKRKEYPINTSIDVITVLLQSIRATFNTSVQSF